MTTMPGTMRQMNLAGAWAMALCAAAACAMALTTGTGCAALGYAADKAGGGGKAEFELADDRPVVLLVDRDEEAMIGRETLDRVGRDIAAKLMAGGVEAPVIESQRLGALRTKMGAAYDDLKPQEIGQSIGARTVIHLRVRQWVSNPVISSGDITSIDARLRVLDAETGNVLWPANSEGKIIRFKTTPDAPDSGPGQLASRAAAPFLGQ